MCHLDPNVVTITLPDERLEYLRGLFEDSRSKAEIEGAVGGGTRVTLVDSRGIIKGDYTRAVSDGSRRGSSRGGDRLAPVDVLVHLLRGFEDKDLTHVEETVDPIRDHHTVHSEIMAKVRCAAVTVEGIFIVFAMSTSWEHTVMRTIPSSWIL